MQFTVAQALALGCALAATPLGATEVGDETSLLQNALLLDRAASTSTGREVPLSLPQAAATTSLSDRLMTDVVKTTIDLDLPPEQRWVAFYASRREWIIPNVLAKDAAAKQTHTPSERKQFLASINFTDQELLAEMRGIVTGTNHPNVTMDHILWNNVGYERGVAQGCTSIVIAGSGGTVLHGRNLDLPQGVVLSDQFFEATYTRGGKPLLTSIQFYGTVGTHTGFRYGGWSFSQNSRPPLFEPEVMAEARKGAQPNTLIVRRALQDINEWSSAVQFLAAVPLMAPMYFTMAGPKPYEGAVITRDARGNLQPYANTAVLDPRVNRTFLAQTNDDMWKPPMDIRRPAILARLSKLTTADVNASSLLDVLESLPALNPASVYTYMMQPSTDMGDVYLAIDSMPAAVAAVFGPQANA